MAFKSSSHAAACCALALGFAGCAEPAKEPVSIAMGARPQLDKPATPLIPTVKIAEAIGWTAGGMPTAAPGLKVQAFATGLDHPRWLHVLPNGDVLVAETNAPERPDEGKGIKGYFQGQAMKKAGAVTPTANRITLLRDKDGDGVAETKSVFMDGPQLALRHGADANGRIYIANTDAVVSVPYTTASPRSASRPRS